METIKHLFAQKLMDIKAIKLQPNDPFTWASGWKSPIYTDNRKTLGFADVRSFVKLELCHLIQENFPEAEAVAGVATGAIAQGALVADELGLPYAYVRPKPKDHGMGNQVEGELKQGAKVIVVEDLISTGGSSLKAVEALRQYGVEVIGMVASFTYGFPVAEEAFREAGVKLITLSDYNAVLEQAAKTGYIKADEIDEMINNITRSFLTADTTKTNPEVLKAFLKYNRLVVYTHPGFQTVHVVNSIYPQGCRISIGIFSSVISTIRYEDLVVSTGAARGDYNKQLNAPELPDSLE